MAHRTALAVALAIALAATVPVIGCRGDEPDPPTLPTRTPSRVTAIPLATDTAPPTSEADATGAAAATLAAAPQAVETVTDTVPAETLLPDDPEAVIVQLARIEPSPWEPRILAQMQPHFSLQANGFGVFTTPFGESVTGWYQTAITPSLGLNFLKILMDEIDVLDLATRHGIREAEYVTGLDGRPAGTGVLGVIYVRAKGREGRLVIPEETMRRPPEGPDHDRLLRLHSVVLALQVWKQGVARTFEPEQKLAVANVMGWWSDLRLPFTPESAAAFGTAARSRIPADAPVADWPLPSPTLADAFDADYGAEPAELLLQGDELTLVLEAERQRPASFWGPLWQDAAGPGLYLVGVRVGVPGSNQTVLDYEYELPRRGIGLPTATPAPLNPQG